MHMQSFNAEKLTVYAEVFPESRDCRANCCKGGASVPEIHTLPKMLPCFENDEEASHPHVAVVVMLAGKWKTGTTALGTLPAKARRRGGPHPQLAAVFSHCAAVTGGCQLHDELSTAYYHHSPVHSRRLLCQTSVCRPHLLCPLDTAMAPTAYPSRARQASGVAVTALALVGYRTACTLQQSATQSFEKAVWRRVDISW